MKFISMYTLRGKQHAKRHIVHADSGRIVLIIHTGEYLQRLGNQREMSIWTVGSDGDELDNIYCEHGGIIRAVLRYLNDGQLSELEAYKLSEVIPYLDKIKEETYDN